MYMSHNVQALGVRSKLAILDGRCILVEGESSARETRLRMCLVHANYLITPVSEHSPALCPMSLRKWSSGGLTDERWIYG
jgi:hypothetical protein